MFTALPRRSQRQRCDRTFVEGSQKIDRFRRHGSDPRLVSFCPTIDPGKGPGVLAAQNGRPDTEKKILVVNCQLVFGQSNLVYVGPRPNNQGKEKVGGNSASSRRPSQFKGDEPRY